MHLRLLAPDQGAAGHLARFRETTEQLLEDGGLELAGRYVIEKKERARPEHGDVVDTMVDEVLANCVMTSHGEGDF